MKTDYALDKRIRALIVIMNNASVAFHPPFDLPVFKNIKKTNSKGFKAFIEYTRLTDDWIKSIDKIAKWPKDKKDEFIQFVKENQNEKSSDC